MSRLLLLLLLLFAAGGCRNADRNLLLATSTPQPATHFDLRSIATSTGTPAVTTFAAADQATAIIDALPATQQPLLQLLPPLHFSSASTIDMLRLSTGARLPPASGSAMLLQIGLRWVAEQLAVTKPAPAYAQLRISIAGFDTSASASRYLNNPLLLPEALREHAGTSGPAMLGAGAQQRQAQDTMTRTDQPGTIFRGERQVLLWHRGQLVLSIEVAGDAGQIDAPTMLALASRLDQQAVAVAGYSSS